MRHFQKELPDVDEVVMCQVQQIAEMGAYVKLLEYDGAEGMILLSELSRRRIRSIQKLIRVGRNEVVVVLRVDKEKGYIDLSKRRVSPEDVIKCEERFNKSKAVHSILAHVAGKLQRPVESLYEAISWPLDNKYGHAYDAFKLAITEPEKVFEGIEMDEDVQRELQANIARRLTPQPVKIRADIEVTCFGYEGIDAIKKALKDGEALQTESIPIKIKLVAPPLYVLISNSTDKLGGIELMEKAIEKITETIKASGGDINIKMKPKTVSEVEDQELAQLMARVEKENAEVEGDE
ncbi:putative SUI2-translation initiation factor eIF-2 alpha chain [Violaceomyces palustris]|uniref:SUI2-translation initiation factor eIF-2 alpha chain n=1 Tax=Violaceomyces palustris TaxID=1673888 RepID=A0ACD0NTA6_9BASI|nr:putative SUI2-translation initiation factor eIF-2 alpha chain [Violaceomyces palustris]